jgi:hypothetical protein
MTVGVTQASGVTAIDGGPAMSQYSVQAPTTGFTITVAALISALMLEPAGTLASGTVTFPASPPDGFELRLSSSQIITALTLTPGAGQTIVDTISTLALGGCVTFKYVASTLKWYRIAN